MEGTQISVFEQISIPNWKDQIEQLCEEIAEEKKLPKGSLYLNANMGKEGKNADKRDVVISYSVCIYEPEYPGTSTASNDETRNTVVMNIKPDEKKTVTNIEFLVRDVAVEFIGNIPNTIDKGSIDNTYWHKYQVKYNGANATKSYVEGFNQFVKETLLDYLRKNIDYELRNYVSKAESFGCCSRFEECSDAKECVHPNKLYGCACAYKKNLDKGRIFYGKNRNID